LALVHDIRFENGFICFSAHPPIESRFFNNWKGSPSFSASPQQHQTQPAQSTGFHEVTLTGAHWITVDPFGCDLRAALSFNRIVQSQDNWTATGKRIDQHLQQNVAAFQTRLYRTVENTMIILKMLFTAQPHYPQDCCNCPLSRRYDCAYEQDLGLFPYSLGKQLGIGFYDRVMVCLQGSHWLTRGGVFAIAYPASCNVQMDKV
jgi:hypothetical protein